MIWGVLAFVFPLKTNPMLCKLRHKRKTDTYHAAIARKISNGTLYVFYGVWDNRVSTKGPGHSQSHRLGDGLKPKTNLK